MATGLSSPFLLKIYGQIWRRLKGKTKRREAGLLLTRRARVVCNGGSKQKKGQTKGLQRERSLTVYYYRKLNQEAINAVYTILPLITPPLLLFVLITPSTWWWSFQRYHVKAELSAADNNAASPNGLYYHLSILYVRDFVYWQWHEIELWTFTEIYPIASWNKKTCKGK